MIADPKTRADSVSHEGNVDGRAIGPELDRFLQTRFRGIDRYSIPIGHDAIVVTGGTGCIGTALLAQIASTYSVRVVSVSRRPPIPARRISGVTYLSEDVRNLDAMCQILSAVRPRLIIHLAAQRDPGLAEQTVAETISINVMGTISVLQAAAVCNTSLVSFASTGKAMRYYTSDVYAATKLVAEYVVARAAEEFEFGAVCARFTHVVDNSILLSRLHLWAQSGQPVRLHGTEVAFYVQSALECAQLLMVGAAEPFHQSAGIIALRNLGWPPISLLQLAQEVVAFHGGKSPIEIVGFEPGYEEQSHPATSDPLTAGNISPLINALEASRSQQIAPLVHGVDGVRIAGASDSVDKALDELVRLVDACASGDCLRQALGEVSRELLVHRLNQADVSASRRLADRSSTMAVEAPDHVVISDTIARWRGMATNADWSA